MIDVERVGLRFDLRRRGGRTIRSLFGIAAPPPRAHDELWALRDVSFQVERGVTVALVGRNGAGKSSLLRLLGGIYAPDEGRLSVDGSVSTVFALNAGLEPELTGRDNVMMAGVLLGFGEREVVDRVDEIVEFAELGDFIDAELKTHSSGMQARLGFSIAIHLHRDVVLLDELLAVGDAEFSAKCELRIEDLVRSDRTVILATHEMDIARHLADRVLWLEQGRVRRYGDPADVVDEYLRRPD